MSRMVAGTAILVGAWGNLLIRSPQGPGLNGLLFFAALALAIRVTGLMTGRSPSREAWLWIAAGTLMASGLAIRASPALQTLGFLAAAAAFTFPALRAGAAWMRGSGVSDYLESIAGALGYAAFGAFRVAADTLGSKDRHGEEGARPLPVRLKAIVRGLILATPLLLVFGALFVSADRVFADIVNGLVGTVVEDWISHLVVTGILAWLAAGYFTGFFTGTRMRGALEGRIPRPSIGIVEIGIALGLVCLLFATFVAVQFRYLFGGAGIVEVTPGLTYSEYAREGFGQLALASVLVLPTLLLSDWMLRLAGRLDRTVFRTLGSLQLVLLAVVIASAFRRVLAYQEAYGLTESRLYGVILLGWLVGTSAWFGWTVLRGRRERFALPVLASAYVVLAALFVANPNAWIARTNIDRAGVVSQAPTVGPSVDVTYLASLGADAVPTLLDALPDLPPDARCRLAASLLERWRDEDVVDWRSWNLAAVRAREAVRAETAQLQRIIDTDAGCADE